MTLKTYIRFVRPVRTRPFVTGVTDPETRNAGMSPSTFAPSTAGDNVKLGSNSLLQPGLSATAEQDIQNTDSSRT